MADGERIRVALAEDVLGVVEVDARETSFAPGIERSASTGSASPAYCTSKKSQIEAQNSSSESIDQRRSAS